MVWKKIIASHNNITFNFIQIKHKQTQNQLQKPTPMQTQAQHLSSQALQPQEQNIPNPPDPQHYAHPDPLNESKVHSVISHSSNPQNLLKYFQEYQPNNKWIKMTDVHASEYLKLKKYKESVYYGEFVNGRRHGKGIMVYDDGRVYEGQWECDVKMGKGWQKFGNESLYTGDYVNGKPQGVGKYIWPNGQSYDGEWHNGMKQGSGMWRGAKGDSYIGEWKHGKADGYGVHTWVNGDRYEGEFKECLKHGEGIEKFANGDIYKGFYQNGKPSGFGQYYWANGSYFKGKFKNGLRNGQGIWKRNTGPSDKYQGQYQNDKKSGYGIFTWATGNIYKGNYQSDIRNGYGQMYWADGSYYKGQWKNGIQNGEGELYVPGEKVKKGIFQDNVLVIVEKQSSLIVADPHNYLQYQQQQQKRGSIQDPEKTQSNFTNSKHNTSIRKQDQKQRAMPQKLTYFKSRDYHPNYHKKSTTLNTKNPRQHKSIDQNIVVRYSNSLKDPHPTFSASYNKNHPLLPKKYQSQTRQQKYTTLQNPSKQPSSYSRNPIKPLTLNRPNPSRPHPKNKQIFDRILHSSFYMHQFHINNHNRANTSINGSRADAEVQSGHSGHSGSVEYGGPVNRGATRVVMTTDQGRGLEEMRYYNRTRLSKDVKTPNL